MAAAAATASASAHVLECGICTEAFSATVEARQPHVFTSCGHSVCRACADQLAQRGCAACSFCKTPVRLPLAKNHALMDQLEMLGRLLPSAAAAPAPRCESKSHAKQEGGAPLATRHCKANKMDCCDACGAMLAFMYGDDAIVHIGERSATMPAWKFGASHYKNTCRVAGQYQKAEGGHLGYVLVDPQLPLDRVSYLKVTLAGSATRYGMLGAVGSPRPVSEGYNDRTTYCLQANENKFRYIEGKRESGPGLGLPAGTGTYTMKFDPAARTLSFRLQGSQWTCTLNVNTGLSRTWHFMAIPHEAAETVTIEPLTQDDVGW